ncbi:NRDE family protein [Acetobacteraceae bacterium H6797]|nr:NRDE family protein [Acetobacteraceae bacterium H6797]
MCTVILLRRPGHAWPLLVAANRDERLDRAWDTPGPYWPEHPGVIAGRDRTAGGTWMALDRHDTFAAILNRPGSLGPEAGKRSRGDLPLLALNHGSARAGMEAILALPAAQWRPFNMVIADAAAAWFLRWTGNGHTEAIELPPGLSMVTALDPNDMTSPRTRRHLPRFQAAPIPVPEEGDWSAWSALLDDSTPTPESGAAATLRVPPTAGFGTVCQSLLALPQPAAAPQRSRKWLFRAALPPGQPYQRIEEPAA